MVSSASSKGNLFQGPGLYSKDGPASTKNKVFEMPMQHGKNNMQATNSTSEAFHK
jgi:hypothetical protein